MRIISLTVCARRDCPAEPQVAAGRMATGFMLVTVVIGPAMIAAFAGPSAGPTLVRARTPPTQEMPAVTVTAPTFGPQVPPVSP